jgi:hypothetical protein
MVMKPDTSDTGIIDEYDDCWLWTGACTKKGYGCIRVGKRVEYAHRFAFQMVWGMIPAGIDVHHKCVRKHCVNPEHIECIDHIEHGQLEAYKRWREFNEANR